MNIGTKDIVTDVLRYVLIIIVAFTLLVTGSSCSNSTGPEEVITPTTPEAGLQVELARRQDQGLPTIGWMCWWWCDGIEIPEVEPLTSKIRHQIVRPGIGQHAAHLLL